MRIKLLSVPLFIVPILLILGSGCRNTAPVVTSTPTALPPVLTVTIPRPTGAPSPTQPPTPSPVATPIQSGQVILLAVGDIMLARTVGEQVLAKGPGIVFAGVQSVLDAADLRVGNLECAITDLGVPTQKSYTLKAPPATAAALSLGKFDLLSLANNHAMDYGFQGLLEAQKTLSKYGIASVGAGADFAQAHTPVILQRNGLHLAFLAYVDVPVERDGFDTHTWTATASRPGVAWADPAQIKADVIAARLNADLVIVLLHSGIEIGAYQSKITGAQRLEAQAAIDAGAAVVIGSHPHQLEPIERYHGGLIAYSLGNFVFDNYWGIANATVILRVVLTRSGVQSYDYVPVLIDKGLPHGITPDLAPAIGTMVAPVNP